MSRPFTLQVGYAKEAPSEVPVKGAIFEQPPASSPHSAGAELMKVI